MSETQTKLQAFADKVAHLTGAEVMDDDYVIGYWARVAEINHLSPITSAEFAKGVQDAANDIADDESQRN